MTPRITAYGKPARATYPKMWDGEKYRDAHRVVMERFLGRKLGPGEVVHHINGDKWDNRPENLEVMPLAEHSRMHQRGEGGTNAKLTEDAVLQILEAKGPRVDIAIKFGVSAYTVADIKRRRTWKHLAAAFATE